MDNLWISVWLQEIDLQITIFLEKQKYIYYVSSDKNHIKKTQAWLQGTPTRNPKTHLWPKSFQLTLIMKLNCFSKNEVKRSSHPRHILYKRIKLSDSQSQIFGAIFQEPNS